MHDRKMFRRKLSFSPPPCHEFEAGAIWVGARNPFFQQIEMRRESPHNLVAGGSEGWPIGVRDHVKDGEVLAMRREPTNCCTNIVIAQRWIDRAKERVFE